MRHVLILMLVTVFGLAGLAVAAGKASPAKKAAGKVVEGVKETVEGTVQVPVEMYETAKESPAKAVTVAPLVGAKETAKKTTEGAVKAGTAVLPPYGSEEEKAKAEAESVGQQLKEGLKETVEGTVQVPVEMYETAKESPAKAVTIAPIKGAKETVQQTTEGAVKAATSILPGKKSE
ncbi:MAG: hypothetical protein ABH845_00505 [Candidatus Omnitrophota bacterium]